MEVKIESGISLDAPVDAYLIPVFEKEDYPNQIPKPDPKDFAGKKGQSFWTYSSQPKRLCYVGLGKIAKFNPNSLRKSLGDIAKTVRDKKYTTAAILFPPKLPNTVNMTKFAEITIEALILGSYRFEALITDAKRKTSSISEVYVFIGDNDPAEVELEAKYGQIVAEATNFARDLANHPHNRMNSIELAQRAEEMAKSHGINVTILDKEEITKEQMNLFLSVNQGSSTSPKFVILDYFPEAAQKTLVLVGKGITFDTGGISLKPVMGMKNMIYDMCGAAAVIGAMQAIAQLKSKIRVIGLTPLTDNSPSGSASKPGDIITSKSGKTVEIISTDAEGRLILADALTFAERYNPDYVLDLATLTGACVIALGHVRAGVFLNEKTDETKQKLLFEAADYTGDRLWQLPMDKEYFKLIKPKHADLQNSGGRWGGAIAGAIFLAQFAKKYPWAHLDIAGTSHVGSPEGGKPGGFNPHGATGFGVRLIVDFIRRWIGT
ncbi:MAG: leucyl aminopeptidase [Candidatus Hodarchaeota archaeon]